jgi:hypothetical protein
VKYDWILVLSYIVTPSPSDEANCAPIPEQYAGDGEGCIAMPVPESPVPIKPKEIVLNFYSTKKDCLDQAVRFADRVEVLPPEVTLMLSDSVAESYICRGPAE